MPTVTIYGDVSDGRISSTDTTDVYATAREGGAFNAASSVIQVGQSYSGTTFVCWEAFLAFDTSSVGAQTTGQLLLYFGTDLSTTDFTVEARLYDWGATLESADWVAGSALSGNTLLATLHTSTLAAGYNTFTDVALVGNINLSGFTRILLNSDRHRLATTPTSGVSESATFKIAETAGTTEDPALVFTTLAASSDEILNPDLDIAVNSWTTDTGATTNLYEAINEDIASDTDYIQSPAGPTTAQYYETALETHADPNSSTGHIVHYRYQKSVAGGNVGLTVGLLNGVTELLTVNQQGIETDTTGWAAAGSASLARSIALAHSGSASLETAGGGLGGDLFTPAGTSGFAVAAGVTYTFSGYIRAVGTARSNLLYRLRWYTSAGAEISTSSSPSSSDTTTGWTKFEFTATAPPTAAFGAATVLLPISVAGEFHYFDTMSVSTPLIIDSWAHTNIPNTWTQQDQTLSGAEADSITDYSDLRLRFTPDMVTTDQTVPVPTFVAQRASANSNSAVTTVDLALTGLTVGNYLIIRSSADNSGGGGAARSITLSNLVGTPVDLATDQVFQQNNDPGAASAGVTCNVGITKILNTSGTVRMTYAGSVVQACVAEEWSGIHATTPIVGTPVGANGTASTNFASTTDASVALGNVVYGVIAVEGPAADTFTQDADTTNGSWVSHTELGTTNATADTNQSTWAARKTVTATGAQTYNPTGNVARDSAGLILELNAAPAPAPTIKAQVSWANFELPEAVAALAHYAGINLGENWPISGPVSAGATDS